MTFSKAEHTVARVVRQDEKRWKNMAFMSLALFLLLIIGAAIFEHLGVDVVKDLAKTHLDKAFFFMVLVGFLAQMVDGALGMGYGVISTTLLLSGGLNPAVISGSIHTAEMFSSGASGFSHYRFGNVNKKLFKTLLIPGVLGAIAGAVLLGTLGAKYSDWIRPYWPPIPSSWACGFCSMLLRKRVSPQK
ncbi:sulfite exporter TauE/SafE family protein [Daejeonella oryzae]|uniref:sulfite exporter TauE/SafE family protein n=1 Tax=Daejeonella oryzae TaxID=1122943 RepID=UPI000420C517|nr:sulfite exporter TauE/SafE family protein [Daejeonella oryzae]